MKVKKLGNSETEVDSERFTVLFSYNTPVACLDKEEGKFFKTSRKWSNTTSKHIARWLDGRKVEEKEQTFFDSLL
jgi:hypothetical protein